MPDREKVIKALELCVTDYLTQDNCKICPYGSGYDNGYCWVEMNTDALALLKEQETEIRQLRLALDIAKGTCSGIVMEGR